MKIKAFPFSNVLTVLINLALVYVLYMVTRVAFILENWSTLSVGWDQLSMGELLAGSLRFDSSAILYTNCLWIVLMLFPLHLKERPWWHQMCKWIFVVINSFCLSINLVDTVYSQFTGRRTTATFFSEFSNEGNLGGIFFTELINHWYLLLLGLALIAALWFLYVKPDNSPLNHSVSQSLSHTKLKYYLATSLGLIVAIPFSIFAMRGGFTGSTRPITISNANQYVHSPQQASIVLNTPFSIIRTIGKHPFKDPKYMPEEQLASIYTPLHIPSPADTIPMVSGQKNVMVIILESFSREYFGYYNQALRQSHPDFVSYTPFLDSLLEHSLTFEHTFANGRKSPKFGNAHDLGIKLSAYRILICKIIKRIAEEFADTQAGSFAADIDFGHHALDFIANLILCIKYIVITHFWQIIFMNQSAETVTDIHKDAELGNARYFAFHPGSRRAGIQNFLPRIAFDAPQAEF